ncbi:MAG: Crp/Fnr family transcriptional regulator [Candidatus Binataceae bacterium]|nr:Crp/Fnr family transcriptional regulator [Candidatus Binataceae bacterium]
MRLASQAVQDADLVNRLSGLRGLSPAQLLSLGKSISVSEYERHQTIHEDSLTTINDVHLLLSGIAQLVNYNAAGKPTIIAVISSGLLFKAPMLPTDLRHRFVWTAFSRSRVGTLPLERFVSIVCSGNPRELANIMSVVFGTAGQLFGRYPGFSRIDLRHRLAVAMLELSLRLGSRDARGSLLRVTLPQRVLGDMIGSSRPKVTAVLAEFERMGMIVRENRRIALVEEKLRHFIRTTADH